MLKPQQISEDIEASPAQDAMLVAGAGQRGLELMLAAQQAMFEEMIHTRDDAIEHALVQARVSAELMSKIAGAHSMKDVVCVWRECSQHQMDVLVQDTERSMAHVRNWVERSFAIVLAATRV